MVCPDGSSTTVCGLALVGRRARSSTGSAQYWSVVSETTFVPA